MATKTMSVVQFEELDKKKQKTVRRWKISKLAADRAAVKLKEARDAIATDVGVCKVRLPDGNIIQITQSIREDISWAKAFKTFTESFYPFIAEVPEMAEKFLYMKKKAELEHKSSPTPRWEVREIKKETSNAQMESEN